MAVQFPPSTAQQVEMYTRLVVVEGDPVPTYTFITPSSVTRVLNPCSGAAVSSMPPSGEVEEKTAFFQKIQDKI